MNEFRNRAESILQYISLAENDCYKFFDEYTASDKDKQLLTAIQILKSFSKSYPVILPIDGVIIQLSSDNWMIGDNGVFRLMTNKEQEML